MIPSGSTSSHLPGRLLNGTNTLSSRVVPLSPSITTLPTGRHIPMTNCRACASLTVNADMGNSCVVHADRAGSQAAVSTAQTQRADRISLRICSAGCRKQNFWTMSKVSRKAVYPAAICSKRKCRNFQCDKRVDVAGGVGREVWQWVLS